MKSLRALAGALAVLLAASALALFGGASAAAALDGPGVTGRVTDADTGAPIAGIAVTLFCQLEDPEGSGSSYWGECSSDPADPAGAPVATTTAADGTYELSTEPGTYRVGFRAPDGAFVSEYYDNAARVYEADDVVVAGAVPTTSVDAALDPATAISGTVTSASGAPLADVGVSLYEGRTSSSGSITWVTAHVATTDTNGDYTVDGLVRGDVYRIGFSDYSGTFVGEFYDDVRTITLATDVIAGESPPADAVLARDLGESITGTITDDAGNPVSGVSVEAIRTDVWESVGSATSGEDGTYAISGLDPGEHRINFTLNDPYLWAYQGHLSRDVQVLSDTGAVADLSAYVGGQIAGTITDANGQPIANATVGATGPGAGSGRTDDNGRYVITGLPVGDYQLGFSADGYRDEWYHDHWGSPSHELDTVAVRARETTIVDEALAENVDATGVVSYSDGAPFSSESVVLERLGDSGWVHSTEYRTDDQGRYTTGVLDSGTYRIAVRSRDDGAPTYSDEFTVTDVAQEIVRDVRLDWSPVAITSIEAPAILGTATVGEELVAATGDWSNNNAHLEIQWMRDGQPVGGAYGEMGERYFLDESDAGREISVRVTASQYGYLDGVATAQPVVVAYGQLVASGNPWVTGEAKVGETLQARPGDWSADGLTYTYQWLRDGVAVSGATGETYTLVGDDYGHRFAVEVTASKDRWESGSATSAPSESVALGHLDLRPAVAGEVRIGQTLTASVDVPDGAQVSYSWQVRPPAAWQSSDAFKEVGTASSFTLADRYKNYALRLVVSVSATGYNDATATVDISGQLR